MKDIAGAAPYFPLRGVVVYQELALDFILDNMEGVKDTPGFLELKQEPDLLMEIIFRQAS